MRKFSLALAACVVAIAVVPTTSQANTCSKAYSIRQAVIKKHGKRAPGRNICRFGIKHSTGRISDATFPQKKLYLNQLRKLNTSLAYLSPKAVQPSQSPAGTMSTAYSPSGLASCIVARESGGNPNAANGQYTGIAQWSAEAWVRHGGAKYASSPTGASYQQQLQVLNSGLSRFGCRDWCPYDGC